MLSCFGNREGCVFLNGSIGRAGIGVMKNDARQDTISLVGRVGIIRSALQVPRRSPSNSLLPWLFQKTRPILSAM